VHDIAANCKWAAETHLRAVWVANPWPKPKGRLRHSVSNNYRFGSTLVKVDAKNAWSENLEIKLSSLRKIQSSSFNINSLGDSTYMAERKLHLLINL
jgi:hypothetical protein